MFVPLHPSIAASTFNASSWMQDIVDKDSVIPIKMFFKSMSLLVIVDVANIQQKKQAGS